LFFFKKIIKDETALTQAVRMQKQIAVAELLNLGALPDQPNKKG
jgi:hypothetical protein